MIKRTVEISREPAHLTVELDQLILERNGQQLGRIPCEDLGLLMVDHQGASYSHAALAALMRCDATVVVCGRDHLPIGILLPLADHTQVVWRIRDQVGIAKPLRKQLWKQLVQAKIVAQAENLPDGSAARTKLRALAAEVRSGDPANVEARAARLYWSVWLDGEPFRRDPDGEPPNHFLNYGYAVLRASLARALVAAGLLPALGLHHHNRANAFCLADDLIEPLRPMVDAAARDLHQQGRRELDRSAKTVLLDLLAATAMVGGHTGPLMVALHRMVASLVRSYESGQAVLEIPVLCT
jgi:CRISPR-associated protein Cas1